MTSQRTPVGTTPQSGSLAQGAGGERRTWRTVNITPGERLGRIGLGLAAIVVGVVLLACIPMLVIAVALVAAGVVSAGFLIVAVACTAMMALMMRGMGHGGQR